MGAMIAVSLPMLFIEIHNCENQSEGKVTASLKAQEGKEASKRMSTAWWKSMVVIMNPSIQQEGKKGGRDPSSDVLDEMGLL